MLYRVQNYVTWGEVSKGTVALLLKERGRFAGGEKITGESVEKLGYKSIDALADAIASCKVEYQKLPKPPIGLFIHRLPPTFINQ